MKGVTKRGSGGSLDPVQMAVNLGFLLIKWSWKCLITCTWICLKVAEGVVRALREAIEKLT